MAASPPKQAAPPTAAAASLIMKPWLYLGISRSTFFRMAAAGGAPRAVQLPGGKRPYYRRSDLDRWLASLKPARRRSSRTASDAPPGDQADDGPTAA